MKTVNEMGRRVGRLMLAGVCALGIGGLVGCTPTTVVEDRTPSSTTVVTPGAPAAPRTEVIPVPVQGPAGAPGPAGASGPAGAPGAPGAPGH